MLPVRAFGPFIGGVQDARNPDLPGTGFLRYARHAVLSGAGRLKAAPGSEVAITLMDDQATPAECTSVVGIVPFGDGCLAVAHSTTTDDCYLYRLDAELTGWYNLAGAFTASATATPLGVLWATMAAAPVVHIAEMLGEATITCIDASDGATNSFATRTFTGTALNDLTADLDGTAGAETVYALGCFAFQSHLWLWGFGEGAVIGTTYRPELLRFGGPNGGTLTASGSGSLAIGHRVRSAREAIVGACVAGDVVYVGTTYSLWPIVGYGRDTWDKSKPLDDSYGFIGPHCAVAVNGVCYYWSSRGPMRVAGLSRPEPLWDAIPDAVDAITDPEKIIAAFDAATDQVRWYVRGTGVSGNQHVAAYDTRREVFLGPDTDCGIPVGCANQVAPVTAASVAAATGPSAAPTIASTTDVSAGAGTSNWTNGDTSSGVTTLVEYRQQSTSTWISAGTVVAGVATKRITGLSSGVAYEWRATHYKNGLPSSALGPSVDTRFTTTAELAAPTGLSLTDVGPATASQGWVQWTNSGESGVSTEVYLDDVLQTTVGEGVGSHYVTIYATASYAVKVRHVKSGATDSAFAGPTSATLTYGDAA